MKDTKKPVTLRKMKRMLKGRNYLDIVTALAVIALILWVILSGSISKLDLEQLLWLPVGVIILLLTEINAGRARRTIRKLRKYGELEEALADLNGGDVHRIPYICEHSMQIAENVLGEKFVFLFSCGRIIHYYEIKAVSVFCTKKKQLQVEITDADGKEHTLLDLPSYRQKDYDECLRQLKARYPGCPLPETPTGK